jgi:large subunit ribosomal protein L9
MIRVILRENIKGLGKEGDIVEVKDGYARNYLLPKSLAFEANEFSLRQFELERKKKAKRIEKERELSLQLAEKIKNSSCTITVEAQPDDTLYGAVTTQDIEKSLKEEGFEVDKKQILLEEPIKKLGVYQIPIRVHPQITSVIKVWVVRK